VRLVPTQFPACYARQRLAQAALGNGSQRATIELEWRVRQAPFANQVRGSPGRRLSGVRGARPRQLFGAPVEKSYTSRANIESGDLGRPTATAISRRNVGSIAHPARAASITSAADANKANYERAPRRCGPAAVQRRNARRLGATPARVNADDLDRESLGVVHKTAIAF
jgi:hypothetical protein